MTSVVKCRTCGTDLSIPLEEFKSHEVASEIDGAPHVPTGFYLVSDGEYFTGSERQVIIAPESATNLKDHSDQSRLNGCCGLDGCDGPNQTCPNGHEVATKITDCWIAHAIKFEIDATILEAI
jgi:hypothetical protein